MMNRTKSYYTVRSIVRFLVRIMLTMFVFVGINIAASSVLLGLATAGLLWGVYAAIVVYEKRKLIA